MRLADVSPETAAAFRCLYAVPLLALLARRESRRLGPRGREPRLGLAAGALFAADLILWHHAIEDVGAGLATVLGNLQLAGVAVVLAGVGVGTLTREAAPRAALRAQG